MKQKEIHISIAGKQYRLFENQNIKSSDIENAAKQINKRLADYEYSFKVTDTQDLLAMVLLDYAVKSLHNEKTMTSGEISQAELLLDSHFNSLAV